MSTRRVGSRDCSSGLRLRAAAPGGADRAVGVRRVAGWRRAAAAPGAGCVGRAASLSKSLRTQGKRQTDGGAAGFPTDRGARVCRKASARERCLSESLRTQGKRQTGNGGGAGGVGQSAKKPAFAGETADKGSRARRAAAGSGGGSGRPGRPQLPPAAPDDPPKARRVRAACRAFGRDRMGNRTAKCGALEGGGHEREGARAAHAAHLEGGLSGEVGSGRPRGHTVVARPGRRPRPARRVRDERRCRRVPAR